MSDRAPVGTGPRTHLMFVFDESAMAELASLRHRFDPVMAAGVPPHTTVAYPEEFTDLDLLIERAKDITATTDPFTMHGTRFVTDGDQGQGGVFLELADPSGSWQHLRHHLLAPPFTPLDVRPHLTMVHPRTSDRGTEAWPLLAAEQEQASCQVVASTLALTVTDPRNGLRTVERFPLGGSTRAARPGRLDPGFERRRAAGRRPRALLARRNPTTDLPPRRGPGRRAIGR